MTFSIYCDSKLDLYYQLLLHTSYMQVTQVYTLAQSSGCQPLIELLTTSRHATHQKGQQWHWFIFRVQSQNTKLGTSYLEDQVYMQDHLWPSVCSLTFTQMLQYPDNQGHTTHTHKHRHSSQMSLWYQGPLILKTLRELFLEDQKLSALHLRDRGFPKRNPFLIAWLWALWGLTWNESNLQSWRSCFGLLLPEDKVV